MTMTTKNFAGVDITPRIREAHKKLSKTSVKFLEYVKENPRCLESCQFQELVDWKHISVETRLQPWPLFISQQTRDAFEKASVKVFELIKSNLQRIFSNDLRRISSYFGVSEDYVKQCLYGVSDEHMSNLLARGDFLFTPSGLKCLEYNVTSSIGGLEIPMWEAMCLRNPLISEFVNRHRLKITNKNLMSTLSEHFIDITLRQFPHEDEINIAFVIGNPVVLAALANHERYVNRQYAESLQLKDKTGRLQGRVMFCNYDQMEIRGEALFYKDKRIHTILDNSNPDIPLEFLILFKMGNVLIYNGPITGIMSAKLHIALLSEHEDSDLFSAEERETIKKHIPWTRKVIPGNTTYNAVKINLEDFTLSNREKLVLKPSGGYGGEGVHIGSSTPEKQWKELVLQTFREEQWVVQELVKSYPLLFQWGEDCCKEHEATWGLFVFGSRYTGVLLRVIPCKLSKGVINVHQGARVPIVFEVEE